MRRDRGTSVRVARVIELFDVAREELFAELSALRGLRLLEERRVGEIDVEYAFTPTLLRDVAYDTLPAERRQALHATLAARIEEKYADRRSEFAYDLAHHWTRAGELERARPLARRAALRALALGGPEEASRLIEPFLAPPEESNSNGAARAIGEQQRALLLEVAGKCRRLAGSLDASNAAYREFLALAERLANPRWIAAATRELAWNALAAGDAPLAERLARRAPKVADPELALEIANIASFAKQRLGRHDEALEEFKARADALEREGLDSPHLGFALSNAGQIEFFRRGDARAALALFDRALASYRRHGALYLQSRAQTFRGMALEKLGRFRESAECYGTASDLAGETGYRAGLALCEANRSNLLLVTRDWPAARDAAAAAVAQARASGRRDIECAGLENLGLALGRLGHLSDALDRLREARELGARLDDSDRSDSPRLAIAWTLLLAGDASQAKGQRALLSAEALSAPSRSWLEVIDALLDETLPSIVPDRQALAERRETHSAEEYLRWLDALEIFARSGKSSLFSIEEIERLRAACLEGVAE
jgi:tetratricopeptide (TPR) repeat protein